MYHFIIWPIIIASCIPPITTDDYGSAGQWCWIRADHYGYIWRFVCFYIHLYCYLLLNLASYVVIFVKVTFTFVRSWDNKSEGRKAQDRFIFGKLILFPLVYISLW